jgi:tetratricopeptide (TPR) repeat protein
LKGAAQALAVGQYADAEHAFRALSAGSTRGEALLGLAQVQLETGRYEEAERTATSAGSAQRTLDVRAQTLRGEALYARGKLDAAAKAFEKAARDPAALRAHVLLGRLLQERGQKPEAEPYLMALVEAYNNDALGTDRAAGLCYVAMAARALGSVHDANDAFREAALADRARVETQLEWAALFLDKYDPRHANESVKEALEHNPNSPEAHVLAARLALARAFDFPAAEEHLGKALAVNPNLVSAHVTRAALALREMDIEAADRNLDAALAINPNQLEALSVRAAARFLADDPAGFERQKREVWKRNPHFSRMFSIIAEYAEWEHRYDELIAMAREALQLDPEDALAYATLGLNLLRSGNEPAGLDALHEAWKRDHFNAQVFNTLNLYEQVIGKEYVDFSAPPFVLRMQRDERKALEPYVVPMLRQAYADMQKRYGFTPEGPLHVELYADAQHFSVRTTGLPNVGVQGVCFGKVVTATSPRGGPFNWGQITWHELAHVFHLQLSKNHVPRWFTEGLAEYETIIARPEWRREEDHDLWVALLHDRIPKLRDLNKGFTQARTPDALMTAYYVASQAVVYIVERFGFPKVRPMLEAWGQGRRTPEIFASVLGIDIDQLDADFRAYLKQRLHKYDSDFYVDFSRYDDLDALEAAAQHAPDDPDAQAALALGMLQEDRFAEAEQAGLRAIARNPKHALAHFALTRVALEKRNAGRAQRCLRAIVDGGQDGYILRVLLARAAIAKGQQQEARDQVERALQLDPEQLEGWRILLELAEKAHDEALGRRALEALAGLDQHDRMVNLALMVVLHKQKAFPELERAGERALYIDPEQPRIHRLLGDAYLENHKPQQALFELDRALELGHPNPGGVQLTRARALLALNKRNDAKRAAAAAVAADAKLKAEADALFAPKPAAANAAGSKFPAQSAPRPTR